MLNILAIYGSPRRKHNSDMLLEKALEAFSTEEAAVVKIYAANSDIGHCTGCEGCYKTGRCVIKDQMQQVYTQIDQADIVLTATPVYFYTVTSDLKRLIDRCQAVWSSKYMSRTELISRKLRMGYVFCTAGAPEKEAYFDCTIKVLDLFYKCINTTWKGALTAPDVDQIPTWNRKELMEQAYAVGSALKNDYYREEK